MLSQSLKIKDSLRLNAIVVVFDQAIYAKAMEIKWKHSKHFRDIIVRMGAFHTICTLLGIIGKRFQDAGLRDLCVEFQVIAEGSVSGVMEGRKYNRAVWLHKLVYEALIRQVWSAFKKWVAEKQDEKTSLVDEMFSGLIRACVTMFANRSSRRNFTKTLSLRLPSCLKDTCYSFAARMVSCQSSGSPILTWSIFCWQ